MHCFIWIIILLLGADVALVSVLAASFLASDLTLTSLAVLAPWLTASGVLAALLAFTINLQRARSEDVLKAAKEQLEKAYESLKPLDESTTPSNRRRDWLTAARLLVTAERMANRLAEESHQLIYREHREYWRGRLYDLIFPNSPHGLPSEFYADHPAHMLGHTGDVRDPISEKSLAFLYRFIKWPDGLPDPLENVKNFSEAEIESMRTFGPRSLGDLLAKVNQLRTPRKGQTDLDL